MDNNTIKTERLVLTLQLGDLVRHKYLGGMGIIVGRKNVVSNITMGMATKLTVEWLVAHWVQPHSHIDYFPAFLELYEQSDKNCPPN